MPKLPKRTVRPIKTIDNMKKIDRTTSCFKTEELMEYHKWIKEIPYISFPKGWRVQISPPFAGALVRFRVEHNNKYISVYLDAYEHLGYYGKPYWEIYPYDGDTYRCDMENVDELIKAIKHSLK